MAFNGSGVFNRLYNWVNDKANNIKITASRMDAEMDGMATGLSTCITKDGQTVTTAAIPLASGFTTGAGSVGTPAWRFTADTDSGFYQTTGDEIRLALNGTLKYTFGAATFTVASNLVASGGIDSSAIGATTPAAGTFTTLKTTGTTLTFQSAGTTGTLTWAPGTSNKTITLPNGTTDFTATGGTSQVLKQTSSGAAITVGQLAASDLSNGTTGSGAVVLAAAPTLSGNVVNSSGRLSVGTSTTSAAKLHVEGESSLTGSLLTHTAQSNITAQIAAQNNSYDVDAVYIDVYRAANSGFGFVRCRSDSDGSADTEFQLRGDGTGLCDGSWTGGGADYAEFFPTAPGFPNFAHRPGLTLVLEDGKVRPSLASDPAGAIIGAVSLNPTIVGDAAWNKWQGKHLRDAFGAYVMEDYEVVEWVEAVPASPSSPEGEKLRSYAADRLPDGVVVPSNAVFRVQQRRKLNPDYDPAATYTPRAEREDWCCVGLMGKLRIFRGQKTGDRWVKLRDISDDVEEWLVR
jgi:hypothetical protein